MKEIAIEYIMWHYQCPEDLAWDIYDGGKWRRHTFVNMDVWDSIAEFRDDEIR